MKKSKTAMSFCNNFRHVYRAGYCDLQFICRYIEPQFYNCGIYGWNCDLWIDYSADTVITSGYRNMRGENIPHTIIEKYDRRASDIEKAYNERRLDYEDLLEASRNNFSDLIYELNTGNDRAKKDA